MFNALKVKGANRQEKNLYHYKIKQSSFCSEYNKDARILKMTFSSIYLIQFLITKFRTFNIVLVKQYY